MIWLPRRKDVDGRDVRSYNTPRLLDDKYEMAERSFPPSGLEILIERSEIISRSEATRYLTSFDILVKFQGNFTRRGV